MVVFEETFPSKIKSIVEFLTVFKEKYLEYLVDTPALRDRLEYVVMEAIDNAYEHGNRQDENTSIRVQCWQEEDLLTFSVLDEGEGFAGTISESLPLLTDLNGRGLYSIQEFAHSVSFNDKGNMITITFKTR
ncbi:MAG: ATP-binding protein [Desulfoprunum sp.]|nr:ATP-binding protein [Desulfoprunum sp.]